MRNLVLSVGGLLFLAGLAWSDGETPTSRDALKSLADIIGVWNGTGTPAGSLADKQKGFWTETVTWEWKFKGKDAWLEVKFDKSKHYTTGELRFIGADGPFQLKLQTVAKETKTFNGGLDKKLLTLEREDPATKEAQRLVFNMLHPNRHVYRFDVKAPDRPLFRTQFSVGATKEGESFAAGDGKPECIVSGGLGTTTVTYMGKTYYVCCSGCRDEFRENPEKYIREAEAKKSKKK